MSLTTLARNLMKCLGNEVVHLLTLRSVAGDFQAVRGTLQKRPAKSDGEMVTNLMILPRSKAKRFDINLGHEQLMHSVRRT